MQCSECETETKYLRIQFHNFHKAALNVSQTMMIHNNNTATKQ